MLKKIDRPRAKRIDPELYNRAREIAQRYRLLLEVNGRGAYVGSALELPRVIASGATPNECEHETRELLTAAVATLLQAGKTPPPPCSLQRRDEQINIRVSSEEKVRLEAVARQNGFRSVSDYIRRRALEGAA